jgi:Fe-only nitrogenase accessory protein AnfO
MAEGGMCMKSVSVFLNSEGLTSTLKEEGKVKVYSQNSNNNSWEVTKEIPFSLVKSTSISELRKVILNMIKEIGDCRIFVAREVAGQLYTFLETNGFNIYEINGVPEQFLDMLQVSEIEENKNPIEKSSPTIECYPYRTEVADTYFMNLKAALNSNPNLTSKKILLPFIAKKEFKVLEVICDHIPKWFNDEFEKQGLVSTVSDFGKNEYKVVITAK